MGFSRKSRAKNGLTLLGLAIYLGLAQRRGMAFFCLSEEKSCSAQIAQLVEHILGKDEVTGSIPVVSSIGFIRSFRGSRN